MLPETALARHRAIGGQACSSCLALGQGVFLGHFGAGPKEHLVRCLPTERWMRHLCVVLLNSLDSLERLRSLVRFFVEEHNTQMPYSAFSGQTPDELYFGTAVDLSDQLVTARSKARAERLVANRAMTCDQCSAQQDSPAESPVPP